MTHRRVAARTRERPRLTSNPITIDAGASVIEAVHLMNERDIRRLTVKALIEALFYLAKAS